MWVAPVCPSEAMTRNAHSESGTASKRLLAALDSVANVATRAGSAAKSASQTARDRATDAYRESVRAHRRPTGHSPLKHRANLATFAALIGVGLTGLFHVLAAVFQVLAAALQMLAPVLGVLGDLAVYGVLLALAAALALWIVDTAAAVRAAEN